MAVAAEGTTGELTIAPVLEGVENEPAWVAEEEAALWRWAEAQACGHAPALERVRRGFNAATEAARAALARRRAFAATSEGADDVRARAHFAGDLGVRVRAAVAAATDSMFAQLCLLPEDCRDERAAGLLTEEHIVAFRDRGVTFVDWALKPKQVQAARREAEALDAAGRLAPHPGHIAGGTPVHRGDRITWVRGAGDGALAEAVRLLQGLAAVLEARTSLGQLHVPPEAMLACYPGGGARYSLHRDSTGEEDPRRATCILYLQTLAWNSARDGGELSVLPLQGRAERLEPKGGRLVIFDSRTVEHEVLPARAPRIALTLWLRRRVAEEVPQSVETG